MNEEKYRDFIYKWLDKNCNYITISEGSVCFENKKTDDTYYYSGKLGVTFGDYKFCKLLGEVKITNVGLSYRIVDAWIEERSLEYLKMYGDSRRVELINE